MQQSHSSQLQTIKSIEYNLLSLKSRLHYLQKQQTRSNIRTSKLFESSIPIIKNKILETNQLNKTKSVFMDVEQNKINKQEDIRNSKIQHKEELEKNKMEITRSKIHGSLHIREMSRKNQKIIQDAKKQWIQEKKKKSQLVKACRMESRRKIQEFHTQKQKQLRKLKLEESEQLQRKINDVSYFYAQASKIQTEQQKRQQRNEKTLQKLQKLLGFLQKMRPQLFEQIKQQLNLSEKSEFTDQLIEQILIQTQKRCKNSKPQALRLSLDETKRKLNKHNADQSLIKSIYVYGQLKKIR